MSHPRRPLIAYTMRLEENPDGPRYSVYTDAYGLEMCIDDEWPVDTVLLSPPELVDVITAETGVTSMGTVFAGAAECPSDGSFASLKSAGASFVLVDSVASLANAFSADLRAILRVRPDTKIDEHLTSSAVGKLDIAINIDPNMTPDGANTAAKPIREVLDSAGFDASRIVLATTTASVDETSIRSFSDQPEIDGVLLLNTSYDWIVEILKAVTQS